VFASSSLSEMHKLKTKFVASAPLLDCVTVVRAVEGFSDPALYRL
jgi:hypothetical protein